MKKLKIQFDDDALQHGLEAQISVQNDEPFINGMTSNINEIRRIWENNKKIYKDSESLFTTSKAAKDILSRLNAGLNKRFGINFTILPDITGNACVFPVTSENFNVINGYSENIRESLAETLETLKSLGGKTTEDFAMNMSDISGYMKIYENVLKGVDALEEKLSSDKVEFDLKNAKIKNLPSSMMSIMAIDFVTFFDKLTDREVLAIIMHEVGHQFTHLLNMYRRVRTNTILKDTMKFGLEDKVEKISITLSKEFDISMPKLDNFKSEDNYKEVVLFMEKLTSAAVGPNSNKSKLSSRDSEALADQFASKFGLGPDLFKALNTISLSYNEVDLMANLPMLYVMIALLAIFTIIGIVLLILGILMTSGTLALLAVAIADTVINLLLVTKIGAVIAVIVYFVGGTEDSYEMVYDDKKRRLERIRNDAIRMLRGISASGIDKTIIKSKLDEIYEMDKIIEETVKGKSIFSILGEVIFPWNRKHSRETLVQQLLENLESNKLQILSERLK